jgi:hypothetical protein
MNKIKIGDKVRRTEEGGSDEKYGMNVGEIYTVSSVLCGGVFIILEEISGSWNSEYFVLVDKNCAVTTKKKHVHADLIIAWANGAIIEKLSQGKNGKWVVDNQPSWAANAKFRVKPKNAEPVTEKRRIAAVASSNGDYLTWYNDGVPNVEVTYNPDTKEILTIKQI